MIDGKESWSVPRYENKPAQRQLQTSPTQTDGHVTDAEFPAQLNIIKIATNIIFMPVYTKWEEWGDFSLANT